MITESPIFIVGRARSGTTLMASLLDAHPRLSILPIETRLFTVLHLFPELDLTRPEDLEKFCHHYLSTAAYRTLEVPIDLYKSKIDPISLAATVKSILVLLGERDAELHRKKRWGEKSPRHYFYLKEIFDAFPRAQVIMLVRDPRAILASLLKTPWNTESPETSAREWSYMTRILQQWSSDPRVYPVFYEQLVTETVPVLHEICQWLGEDYSDDMLNRSGLSHRLEKDRGWVLEHRRKTLDTISTEGIQKWKVELPQKQIRLVEHICAEQMQQLGYEPVTSGLGWFDALFLDLKRVPRRIQSRLRYESKRFQAEKTKTQ